jgi:hypothetical protein
MLLGVKIEKDYVVEDAKGKARLVDCELGLMPDEPSCDRV